ncbi:MAG: nitrilase-related carbon-nitrogen hydrolase, partial [Opitutales bacterium]
MNKIKVGLIQSKVGLAKEENLQRSVEKIKRAAEAGAKIICLQELFLSPYFCQRMDPAFFSLAESVPGPTTEVLSGVAKEKDCVIVASLFEKRAAGLYHNTAAVIDADGSYLGKYRKMHIPDDPLFFEKFYFTPGDLGYK